MAMMFEDSKAAVEATQTELQKLLGTLNLPPLTDPLVKAFVDLGRIANSAAKAADLAAAENARLTKVNEEMAAANDRLQAQMQEATKLGQEAGRRVHELQDQAARLEKEKATMEGHPDVIAARIADLDRQATAAAKQAADLAARAKAAKEGKG